MTLLPKVWGDALCRLQEEIPDFAYDAWIAPLAVKLADDRLVLGCQTSFHRDRIRIHYADLILRCWKAARVAYAADQLDSSSVELESESTTGAEGTVAILTMPEFATAPGHMLEAHAAERARPAAQARMLKVEAQQLGHAQASVANGAAKGANSGSAQARGGSALPTPTPTPTPTPPTTARTLATTNYTTKTASGAAAGAGTLAPGAHDRKTAKSLKPAGPVLSAVPDPAPRKRVQRIRRESSDDLQAPKKPPSLDRQQALDGQPPAQQELPFSFESFVVGPCNALAREAALALARQRQRSLNQLYLGGDSGMGKTHLARATAFEARRHGRSLEPTGPSGARRGPHRNPNGGAQIVFTSAEQFTTEFVSAMRNGRSEDFKKRYRGPIGLLIVEDVQFFSGRAKTQLELFHTVQHVLDAGGRVLLTGDRAPRDLVGLDDRMRAQVGRGFVAELDMPDALVRRHILRSKAAAGGVHLPADCLDLLVEASEGSVRDIESVLIQVVTTASLLGRSIDLDLTRDAIDLKSGAHSALAPRKLEVSEIVRIVSAFFGKRPEALASRSRRRDVLVPRQLAMYLAHRYTDASFTEIGRGLGRDHPSVRNAIGRIERLVLENAPVRYQVEALSERIDQTLALEQEERGR